MYNEMSVSIVGVCPLLMHSGRMANPLDEYAKALKEISGKRKKTDQDHYDMAKIEFMASLYTNEDGKVIIPGMCLEGVVVDGAKKTKCGKIAKSGVIIEDDPILNYEGPKSAEGLFDDKNFVDSRLVKVQTARIVRTRPIFKDWSVDFKLLYNDEACNERDIKQWLEDGGSLCGLCDYRPRYGRFIVEINFL